VVKALSELERIVRELRELSSKKPLRDEELNRAKSLK